MATHYSSGDRRSTNGETDEPVKEDVITFYTLPTMRFKNIMQFLLVADLCSSKALWLVGGNTSYFEDHIRHFTVRDSVVDLALLSFVRCAICFFVYGWLEDITLRQIDRPFEPELSKRKCLYHIVILFWSIGSLAYSITKGIC